MNGYLARLGLLSILAAVACDKAVDPPTAATAATLQSVTISGLPSELGVGERAQVTARAAWSDGRSEDITTRVRWTSRSLVCLITAGGAITANEIGECSIEASFEARSATATLPIRPARTFSISGVVREKYELREPPIPGATVTITSGALAGRSTTTDHLGRYTLDGVPRGPVTLRIEAPAFDAATQEVSPDSSAVDTFLAPEMATISWNNSTGGVAAPDVATFRIPFRITHRGYVTLSVYSSQYECGTYETMGAYVRDTRTMPDHFSVEGLDISPCQSYRTGVPELKVAPLPPGNYEFVMWRMWPALPPAEINAVSVTHPR